ncbi:MAG: hypothetical protein QOF57_360 [Frankiaceae bacterium]|jgi:hypothetical protein|nr:hypothetical protein [Frankiaceae bacterium]
MDTLTSWLAGRLPDEWFDGAPEVTVDKDEILIVGKVAAPEVAADSDEAAQRAAETGRIKRFREDTREKRMQIADEAQRHFGRNVAWGASCGETRQIFTSLSAPVMTRLRQRDRLVLDTLVDAGVARSRSDALAWCVRLVGEHEADWLQEMKDALVAVQRAREAGPSV